ncbi:uncharacterized protein ACBT44_005410 isoform 1-T1 [Syngnathus typhle]
MLEQLEQPSTPPAGIVKVSSATKQTRKTSRCHVFRLNFLPAQERWSISLVLSQQTSPLYLPRAKLERGATSRSWACEILCRASLQSMEAVLIWDEISPIDGQPNTRGGRT